MAWYIHLIFSKDVFKEISRDPHITMDAIAKSLGFSQKTIARSIKTLRDNNIIIVKYKTL